VNWSSLALTTAVLLGVLYIFLALAVLSHIEQDKKSLLANRWPVFLFWWPFYGDIYSGSAKKLRLYGRVLFAAIFATYILWFMVKPT
jgi:hypothetical protein